jgi:hypothetical protein
MAIVPAHDDLDDLVEPIEFEISRNDYAAPNRWLGVREADFELE